MHIRCPHCRNPIEMVGKDPAQELTCPSCGSSFSLVDGTSTVTYSDQEQRRLGHFELLDQLGIGAFGSVWKARDTELDRLVAVKIPRKDQLSRNELEQFLREARAAAQLRHPGIVSVHEVGREGDTVYIVSDLIQGMTLSDWLSGQQPTPREAAELCEQVAQALHHAHEQGVIHRDLKPSNIMLDSDGRPHLMDFGLAKREAGEITMTVEGHILGTPAYMSPEQARGEGHKVDRRTDIYSMGVLLFQMLTGELPFRGTPRMLLHQVLDIEPRSPRSLNDRIPRDLETICLKSMAKEPGRRYATAKELADDLHCYLTGQPIQARPVGRIERSWRWCRRNRVVAGLAAAAFISVLSGTAATAFFAAIAQRRATEAIAEREVAIQQKEVALQQREEARRWQYVSNLNLAQLAWDSADVDQATALLAQLVPKPGESDLRGWEWFYLNSLSHRELRTLNSPDVQFDCGALSPDGMQLATASLSAIQLWDFATGAQIWTSKGHNRTVTDIEFSQDGRRLVSVDFQGGIKVSDVNTGALSSQLDPDPKPREERFVLASSAQVAAAISDNGAVRLFETDTGRELRTFKLILGSVYDAALQPDLKRLAVLGSLGGIPIGKSARQDLWRGLSVVDLDTGAEVFKRPSDTLGSRVKYSIDGKQLAITGAQVELLDGDSGKHIRTIAEAADAVEFSPDSRLLATSNGPTVKVWDARTGNERKALKGHTDAVRGMHFSADSLALVTTSSHHVKIWDLETSHDFRTFIGSECAFSPDGASCAVASFGAIHFYHLETGLEVGKITKPKLRGPIAYNRSGDILAVCDDKTVALASVSTGKMLRALSEHRSYIGSITFSPDGQLLASTDANDFVDIFRSDTGEQTQQFTEKGARWSVDFGAGGETIATSSNGPGALLLNVQSGQRSRVGDGTDIYNVAFSKDGEWLAVAGAEPTFELWNVQQMQKRLTVPGHKSGRFGRHLAVAFSPNSQRIVSTCADDKTRLWELERGSEVFSFRTETGNRPRAFTRFSPDGRWLAIQSGSGVRLYDSGAASENLKMGRFMGQRFARLHSTLSEAVSAIEAQAAWDEEVRSEAIRYIKIAKERTTE